MAQVSARNRVPKKRKVRSLIDLAQARSIIQEAFPRSSPTEEQERRVEKGINSALSLLHAPIDRHQLPKPDNVESALRRLKLVLTPKDRWFLEATGRAYRKAHDAKEYQSGHVSFDNFVATTVRTLFDAVSEILKWLNDDAQPAGRVLEGLSPAVSQQQFVTELMPLVFESAFRRKCGSGRFGPGPRFILAALREAGIRSGDDDDAIMETIRQARRRQRKRTGAQVHSKGKSQKHSPAGRS